MLDLNNKQFILCGEAYKENVTKNAFLFQTRFINEEEFTNQILGKFSKLAYYYCSKDYQIPYQAAKEWLTSSLLIPSDFSSKSKYQELLSIKERYSAYFEKDVFYQKLYSQVKLTKPVLSNSLFQALQKVSVTRSEDCCVKDKTIIEYSSRKEEIIALANHITLSIQAGNSVDKIIVSGADESYYPLVKEIFDLYHIPFSFRKIPLIGLPEIQNYLNALRKKEDLPFHEVILDFEAKTEIALSFLHVVEEYESITDQTKEVLPFIIQDLKQSYVKENSSNLVRFMDALETSLTDYEIYVIGMNQDKIPLTHSDSEYLTDLELNELGLMDSLSRNQKEVEKALLLIKYAKEISYSLSSSEGILYPSPMIEEFGFHVKQGKELPLNREMLEIEFGIRFDRFLTYGDKDSVFLQMASYLGYQKNGNLSKKKFQSYNNQFNGKRPFLNFTLSYTQMEKYLECRFRYYCEQVLKIKKPMNEQAKAIGDFFHLLLETDNMEETRDTFLKGKDFSKLDRYYLERIYQYAKKVDEFNAFDSHFSTQEKELPVEKKVKNHWIKGKIDKLMTFENKAVIVDYKTGAIDSDLKPLYYGLKMQLPLYLYFIKDTYDFGGIFYQRVLPQGVSFEDEDIDTTLFNLFRLKGYMDKEVVKEIDPSLSHLEGMKLKSNGDFYQYSYHRFLDLNKQKKVLEKIQEVIETLILDIEKGDFQIDPKTYGTEDFCGYCPYYDICYVKDKNKIKLETVDWLGDDVDTNETK